MKVKVRFVPFHRSFVLSIPSLDETYSSYSFFMGMGAVLLDETGIFLEGEMSKLELGRNLRVALIEATERVLYRNIMFSKRIITIPYAKILKYKQRGIFRKTHVIIYESAESFRMKKNQKRITIRFEFLKSSKQYEKIFSDRLNEYMKTTKSLLVKE